MRSKVLIKIITVWLLMSFANPFLVHDLNYSETLHNESVRMDDEGVMHCLCDNEEREENLVNLSLEYVFNRMENNSRQICFTTLPPEICLLFKDCVRCFAKQEKCVPILGGYECLTTTFSFSESILSILDLSNKTHLLLETQNKTKRSAPKKEKPQVELEVEATEGELAKEKESEKEGPEEEKFKHEKNPNENSKAEESEEKESKAEDYEEKESKAEESEEKESKAEESEEKESKAEESEEKESKAEIFEKLLKEEPNNEWSKEEELNNELSEDEETERRLNDTRVFCDYPKVGRTFQVVLARYPKYDLMKQMCIYGYTLREGISRTSRCDHITKKYEPRYAEQFEECKPFVNCSIELQRGGRANCVSGSLHPPTCYVTCDYYVAGDNQEGKHECDVDEEWKPKLPTCAITGSRYGLVKAPKIKLHVEPEDYISDNHQD